MTDDMLDRGSNPVLRIDDLAVSFPGADGESA